MRKQRQEEEDQAGRGSRLCRFAFSRSSGLALPSLPFMPPAHERAHSAISQGCSPPCSPWLAVASAALQRLRRPINGRFVKSSVTTRAHKTKPAARGRGGARGGGGWVGDKSGLEMCGNLSSSAKKGVKGRRSNEKK